MPSKEERRRAKAARRKVRTSRRGPKYNAQLAALQSRKAREQNDLDALLAWAEQEPSTGGE